jgi:hypothetical protein
MRVPLIIVGCGVLIWIVLVYLSFYWPSCIRAVNYFAYTLFIIGMLNFASFVIIGLFIGGDAVGNQPTDGRYYVSEHGRRTEVSRSIYEYSQFHARSVWGTHPLIFFGAYILYCEGKERKPKPDA